MTPPVSSDVVVVGGGIVGTATAAFLAGRGARVTLVERTEIAAGASGRNSGVIQQPFDDVLAELYRESVTLYRELAAAVPGAFEVANEPAGLLLLGPARAEAEARRLVAAWAGAHPEARPELVADAALRRLEPSLADGLAACRLAIGYPVAPASATSAYAALAERRGARIVTGADARVWREGDAVRGVEVDGRRMAAGAVVVAAGPWTTAITAATDAGRLPIGASWGAIASVGLDPAPDHVLEELDIEIEPDTDVDVAAPASVVPEAGFGFSLVTAAGISALGSTFLPEPPEPADVVGRLRDRGARYLPALRDAAVLGARVCARPVTPDGRPLVGAIPGLRRAFVAAGNGPWGISTGPGTARLVADLVLGLIDAVPASVDPARFRSWSSGQREPVPG